MSSKRTPVRYAIRVKGHLGPQWSEWFDQMTVILEADGRPHCLAPSSIRPHYMACWSRYATQAWS